MSALRMDGAGSAPTGREHRKAGDPTRIAREAELLALARRPGVVELVAVEGTPAAPVLVTVAVEAPDLATGPLPSVNDGSRIVASVASVISELHKLGVVHGAVAPEHVLVGSDWRPVLCSFGYGGRCGESSSSPPALSAGCADPERSEGEPLDPSWDVFGLGHLLRFVVGGRVGAEAVALLEAADKATAPMADRLTASQLADALREIVMENGSTGIAEADGRQGPRLLERRYASTRLDLLRKSDARGLRGRSTAETGRPPVKEKAGRTRVRRFAGRAARRPWTDRSKRKLAAAGVVAAALAFIVARTALSPPGGTSRGQATDAIPVPLKTAPPPSLPEPDTAPVTTAGVGAITVPTTGDQTGALPLLPGCPRVVGLLSADTDGDGCPEALRYSDGILTAGSARWQVGVAGDQVATGDWRCRGHGDLALLHPETGDVFIFDGWAAPDHDLAAAAAGRIEGGFALRASPGSGPGQSCQRLLVDRRDGPPVPVVLGGGE